VVVRGEGADGVGGGGWWGGCRGSWLLEVTMVVVGCE
jgi:hypothetical protein